MFRVGDLVWAKMKGFPAWPARVAPPRKGPKKLHTFVYFFGTQDYAWIPDEGVAAHSDALLQAAHARKLSPSLRQAVTQITQAASEEGVVDEGRSAREKLAIKYRRQLKEGRRHLKKKRFFGNKKRPRAVIGPFGEEEVSHVAPTPKTIGFLGVGAMGHILAHNLLKSGHKVSVWNRSPDKCESLVRFGAVRGASPAAVVAACDITFSCMAHPEAAKNVLFMPQGGVLRGLDGCSGKGYVEMTSLDDQTSQEIGEAVTSQGGRYLEAQLGSGTREGAATGALTVLGAGDLSLFQECETVFHAISTSAYFVSTEVGVGASLSLVLSALVGVVCGAVGECVALSERLGLSTGVVMEAASACGFLCPLLEERAGGQGKRATVSVKNQQKDLALATRLCDHQPTPTMAAANELYKHAKRLGYRHRDYAAIYLATKF